MLSVCQPFLLSIYLVYLTCSKSTALPAKLQVEYAKTKQFCEVPGKRKCWPGCWCPKYHWTLRFSPSYLSKAARLPRKNAARSYEVLRLSRKIILTNLPIWCSKTQPLSGNPRPHLLTCLLEMSFCTAPGRRCRSSTSNACHSFEPASLQSPHVWLAFVSLPRKMTLEHPKMIRMFRTCVFAFLLRNLLCATAARTFSATNFQTFFKRVVFLTFWLQPVLGAKVACTFERSDTEVFLAFWLGLYLAAQLHAFFNSATAKLSCFGHFDLEMCFVPQPWAVFQLHNFQKCSKPAVVLTFWLRNLLGATAGCIFLITHPVKWLRTCRISEHIVRPAGGAKHWKNTVLRDFSNFSRAWSFLYLLLFLWLFPGLLLHLSTSRKCDFF